MNMLGRIRTLHLREGLTLSEIERRTGLTRKYDPQLVKEARRHGTQIPASVGQHQDRPLHRVVDQDA